MLTINKIRENKNQYIKFLKIKKIDVEHLFARLLDLDDDRKKKQKSKEDLQSKSNEISEKIGLCYKSGDTTQVESLKKESIIIKEKIKKTQHISSFIEKEIFDILVQIPNVPHHSVPMGNSDEDNIIIKDVMKMPNFSQNLKPHWDLANKYNLIDFEIGNKITGSGFPLYINKGARLQRALISYFIEKNVEAGYVEYLPPFLVNEDSAFGTGNFPDKEGQMYHVKKDDLYLIPTAEVPITNIFRNTIVKDLPIKCTSYTPCFRREAGSYGKNVRGLNRLHQFDKVEIVQIQHPEKSYETLNEMVNHVSSILDDLKLPYRIIQLCGGDLSFTSALTFDFEVFSAAQNRWLEVSSVSNFESYQSNRLKLRYKDESGKNNLCHTLNGSALAIPRVYAAILENNQTEEGIQVPKVLQKYTGFDIID
tara:strand:- start:102229 stop:103494 length:1266 start_codon:yes stop_codon:yes gene_type:complete